jgi:SagB-type dehydrogenase family enzyme
MEIVSLPPPRKKSEVSVEQCLATRRSVRAYRNTPLALADIGQLLWAAQGITGTAGKRAAPSAGALYPLETYLVAGNVEGLPPGVYRYSPRRHELAPLVAGDKWEEMAAAAWNQECVSSAAAIIAFTAIYRRVTRKYPERGVRLVDMEAGHAAENVLLQAVALGLGSVVLGSCCPDAMKRILRPGAGEEPVSMVALGKPSRRPKGLPR